MISPASVAKRAKWAVYNLLFLVAYPFLLPGFAVRMLRRGGYAARMGDRFALYPESVRAALARRGAGGFVWVHAVSVGEVQVAGRLMSEWRRVEPDVRFCLSTTSSTGWKTAEGVVAEGDVLIYNPLDFPSFVKSALLTVRPRAIVLTESEIWPNFILRADKMGIPLFLANARVSDRSAPRYRAARMFFGDVFTRFTRIFAQSEQDAERIRATYPGERLADGAGNIVVTGSFKFDAAARNEAKEAEMRAWVFGPEGPAPGARVLLGGSTWPGEDAVLLGIYRRILSGPGGEGALLVIAPRHFEKADAVEANIAAAGFRCIRRSRGEKGGGRGDAPAVLLADTTGELAGLYGVADVVFVGKSLCAHGSQNMIEPCLCGKPTFVGPYTENFRPVMADLIAADAIVQTGGADELADRICAAFAGGAAAEEARRLGERAKLAVERRRGVVGRCVAAMRELVVRALPVAALLALAAGCSKEESPLPETEASAPVEAAISQILAFVVPEGGVAASVKELDAGEMTVDAFRRELESFAAENVTVWMPGESRWLLIGWNGTNAVSLASAMDAFALDPDNAASPAEVFASYAGMREDIMPAFSAKLEGKALPEWFMTREALELPWLEISRIDRDILRRTLSEIRSMQNVRRVVLKGNMLARNATDKAGEEAAAAEWARAMLRNPRDPMLLERLDRLKRNAKGFLEVGKVLQAMKCYETVILVNPKDAAAVSNFGLCLKKIGRTELAGKVLDRAKELMEAASAKEAEVTAEE